MGISAISSRLAQLALSLPCYNVYMKTINGMTFFWGREDALSNFFKRDFMVGGLKFNCNEQYIMWSKAVLFGDNAQARAVRQLTEPLDQRNAGRKVIGYSDDIWFANRTRIAVEGALAKFGQNKDLGDILLGTEGTALVEASPSDKIWGVGLGVDDPRILDRSKWRGQNLMGDVAELARAHLGAERRMRMWQEQLRLAV